MRCNDPRMNFTSAAETSAAWCDWIAPQRCAERSIVQQDSWANEPRAGVST